MYIDRFASHHGCWLGWYSGWSNSRLGVGQQSRKQCSFLGCKWAARNQLSDVDFRHLKHVFQKWCEEERHCFSLINSNGVRSYDMKTIVIIAHQKNSSATSVMGKSSRCWGKQVKEHMGWMFLKTFGVYLDISSAQYRDAWRYVMHWRVGVLEACHWAATNQCRVAWDGSKLPTHVPTKRSLSGLLQVRPRAQVFPFDSKVLAPSRGIMYIDRFASHHGCWLGWYSGWSSSRLGVGQRSRQQCSFPGCKWAARNQIRDVDFRHLKHVFQKWCQEERYCFWSTATAWEVMILNTICDHHSSKEL